MNRTWLVGWAGKELDGVGAVKISIHESQSPYYTHPSVLEPELFSIPGTVQFQAAETLGDECYEA